MTGRLDADVAVVTGGAAGIGRATAGRLAVEGARVAVADVDETGAERVARAIVDAGGTACAIPLDVTDEAAVEAAFARIAAELGDVRVLVACAGGARTDDRPIDELTAAAFDATVARDLRGTALCAGAAVRSMRAGDRGGAIVTFASYHALGGDSGGHAYVAAKGGVIALTRALAARYGTEGIRANVIAPGVVLTDRVRARIAEDDVDLDAVRQRHPFAVAGPEAMAEVALFLASPEARTITGCTVVADGGLSLY
ncbi:MAG TPA: SDR family NAD(P)-dependent oxidoreductase [Iamia sp.]|nr:SDR family NAD(P)-dependent oxidoreductase [Iamia sp.]